MWEAQPEKRREMKQKEYRPMKNRKAHKGTMGAVLLLAALFTSCGADDPLPAGGPLRLTGVEVETGEGSAATRAAVTTVEAISVYATTEAHVLMAAIRFRSIGCRTTPGARMLLR